MIRIPLDPLCSKQCKKGKCKVCQKCTHKYCPRPQSKCNCNTEATTATTNEAFDRGERSTKWDGHIIPGIDVPTVPLSFNFRTQAQGTIKKIDQTIEAGSSSNK